MSKTTDKNAKRPKPARNTETNESESENDVTPILVSYIYDFMPGDQGLAGDGGGRPGTLGGPLGDRVPKFKVFTYPYIPGAVLAPNIEHN